MRAVCLAAVTLLVALSPLAAQNSPDARLRAQQQELERIRRERTELQRRMSVLQSTVHDLSEEVSNLDRQADATARLVRSLDAQLSSITEEVGGATSRMVRAEDELVVKRAVLQRRLVDIYKRGPLYSVEVLLSAQSIGALVARYKYLHVLAQRDKALVKRVEELRNQIRGQRTLFLRLQTEVEENRAAKAEEEQRLRSLEEQRARSLVDAKRQTQRAKTRLAQIARDEARLGDVIASLEAARRRAESRSNAPAPAASTLRTADLGKLDWPVDGEIIYRYGRVVNPNNTTVSWKGIGIAAPEGTIVKAVSSGEVVYTAPFSTYGLTVIVQHGGGDYSVYGSLQRVDVTRGMRVRKGQTIGTVGSTDPDLPAHLHFEMRPKGRSVDPLEWLRGRR